MKKVVIIAGPNGAGKTTFAREFLPNEAGLPVFLNADTIAVSLSPFDPEAAAIRAGRILLSIAMWRRVEALRSRRRCPVTRTCGASTNGAQTAISSS